MPQKSPRRFLLTVAALLACLALPTLAFAAGGAQSAVGPVMLGLAVIIAGAKLGGDLAVRLGQPSVLGELIVGVLLGNLSLVGLDWFDPIKANDTIMVLAQIGVVILLFEVGLESSVADMMKVGLPSFMVATLGVVAPFILGWGVGAWLLPESSVYVHIFLGATLTATSVGITARVLQDLNRSKSAEARIILGAAVIDDVMGLVILAVVQGIILAADRGAHLSYGGVALVLCKAVCFLVGSLLIGAWLSTRLFRVVIKMRGAGLLVTTALSFCFLLAYLASLVGLAPIVGAYAAGLILDDVHFREFRERGERGLEELIHPISVILSPVFFVTMGMLVDLSAFANPAVLGLAALLTLAAIAGKQACALGALGRGLNATAIGVGMVPRGEVGLIFANIGLGLAVAGKAIVDAHILSAVVIMVIVTTLITPPALKWAFNRPPAA